MQTTTEDPADEEENKDKDDDSKFMWALQGELALGLTYPKVMMIPGNALEARLFLYLVGSRSNTKRKDRKLTKAVWFTASSLGKEIGLPSLIPVPPCPVYGALEKDINALIVYKYWMVQRQDLQELYKTMDIALRSFLKGQVVKPTTMYPQGQLCISTFIWYML